MRIQSINNNYNQNNISHKAYFKHNSILENLYKNAPKDNNLVSLVDKFKNSLPNHELVISELMILNPTHYENFPTTAVYRVFNKTIDKSEDIEVTDNKWALSVLLNRIYLYRETLFSKEENDSNVDLYKELTSKSI